MGDATLADASVGKSLHERFSNAAFLTDELSRVFSKDGAFKGAPCLFAFLRSDRFCGDAGYFPMCHPCHAADSVYHVLKEENDGEPPSFFPCLQSNEVLAPPIVSALPAVAIAVSPC